MKKKEKRKDKKSVTKREDMKKTKIEKKEEEWA
jgi:hypothetical protein